MPLEDPRIAARATEAWHRDLVGRDLGLHEAEAARTRLEVVRELEERLAAADAARHALTQASLVRDRIIHEQALRLREQDERVLALEERLVTADAHAARLHADVRLLHDLSRPSTLVRRAVRKAVRLARRALARR